MGPPISMNDHIPPAHLLTSRIYISLAYMGPPGSIGNHSPPGLSVIIEDIQNMRPLSAGPSDTGYYVGWVAHIIQNLSLKGLQHVTNMILKIIWHSTNYMGVRYCSLVNKWQCCTIYCRPEAATGRCFLKDYIPVLLRAPVKRAGTQNACKGRMMTLWSSGSGWSYNASEAGGTNDKGPDNDDREAIRNTCRFAESQRRLQDGSDNTWRRWL
jgi:hypothetical protein